MIRRGDVCWVDLDPVQGSEARGRHPAVVVSSDETNRAAARVGGGVITVVPLTTDVTRVRSYQICVEAGTAGLPQDSKAQTEQIRALAFQRIATPPVGAVPADVMARLDRALRRHLAL